MKITILILLSCMTVSAQFGLRSPSFVGNCHPNSGPYYGIATQPLVWLKADAQSFNNGDAVGAVTDSGGLGNGFGQTSAGSKPTFKTGAVNGLPGFYFDGSDCLTNPALSISTFSIFLITSNSSSGIAWSEDVFQMYLQMDSTCSGYVVKGVNASGKTVGANWGVSQWLLVQHSFDGTHAGHVITTNGVSPSLTDCVGSADPGTGSISGQISIGSANNAGNFPMTGHIAEYLLFTPKLSSGDETTVRAGLRAKYSLY